MPSQDPFPKPQPPLRLRPATHRGGIADTDYSLLFFQLPSLLLQQCRASQWQRQLSNYLCLSIFDSGFRSRAKVQLHKHRHMETTRKIVINTV